MFKIFMKFTAIHEELACRVFFANIFVLNYILYYLVNKCFLLYLMFCKIVYWQMLFVFVCEGLC